MPRIIESRILPSTIPADTTLAGKTVIVTGANAGLGFEAVRQFLILGAHRIVLAVRTPAKGEAAVKQLLADPSVQKVNPSPVLMVLPLDLEDYDSVLRFAAAVKDQLDRLDVLLLNGGIQTFNWETVATGHERILQVNYLSNALLALSLLPLLSHTASLTGTPSRLTWVSSQALFINSLSRATIAPDTPILQFLNRNFGLQRFIRYSDTKLLVSLFVQTLATHVSADKVIVDTVCPGMVYTDLDRHLILPLRLFMGLVRTIRARSIEDGARTYVYAALVVGPEAHGVFFLNNEITPIDSALKDPGKHFQKKLWDETLAEMIKLDSTVTDGLA